jgi:hypothetical protein
MLNAINKAFVMSLFIADYKKHMGAKMSQKISKPMTRRKIKCTCNQHPDLESPCCEDLKQMVNDCRVGIIYDKEDGYFAIKRPPPYRHGSHSIPHCPWCGSKFPEEFTDKYPDEHLGSLDPETLEMKTGPVKGRKLI